ncbi:hypothetical protein RQP46_000254 [Phenoliferia psychrophenolica]
MAAHRSPSAVPPGLDLNATQLGQATPRSSQPEFVPASESDPPANDQSHRDPAAASRQGPERPAKVPQIKFVFKAMQAGPPSGPLPPPTLAPAPSSATTIAASQAALPLLPPAPPLAPSAPPAFAVGEPLQDEFDPGFSIEMDVDPVLEELARWEEPQDRARDDLAPDATLAAADSQDSLPKASQEVSTTSKLDGPTTARNGELDARAHGPATSVVVVAGPTTGTGLNGESRPVGETEGSSRAPRPPSAIPALAVAREDASSFSPAAPVANSVQNSANGLNKVDVVHNSTTDPNAMVANPPPPPSLAAEAPLPLPSSAKPLSIPTLPLGVPTEPAPLISHSRSLSSEPQLQADADAPSPSRSVSATTVDSSPLIITFHNPVSPPPLSPLNSTEQAWLETGNLVPAADTVGEDPPLVDQDAMAVDSDDAQETEDGDTLEQPAEASPSTTASLTANGATRKIRLPPPSTGPPPRAPTPHPGLSYPAASAPLLPLSERPPPSTLLSLTLRFVAEMPDPSSLRTRVPDDEADPEISDYAYHATDDDYAITKAAAARKSRPRYVDMAGGYAGRPWTAYGFGPLPRKPLVPDNAERDDSPPLMPAVVDRRKKEYRDMMLARKNQDAKVAAGGHHNPPTSAKVAPPPSKPHQQQEKAAAPAKPPKPAAPKVKIATRFKKAISASFFPERASKETAASLLAFGPNKPGALAPHPGSVDLLLRPQTYLDPSPSRSSPPLPATLPAAASVPTPVLPAVTKSRPSSSSASSSTRPDPRGSPTDMDQSADASPIDDSDDSDEYTGVEQKGPRSAPLKRGRGSNKGRGGTNLSHEFVESSEDEKMADSAFEGQAHVAKKSRVEA